jgi:hypothetical protein
MPDPEKPKREPQKAAEPGPARLYVLLAGIGLALLGVLGLFYDATFGTGDKLTSDDLAGILNVNGWRNVVYVVTGIVALAAGPRSPRTVALSLGAFYLTYGIWGLAETDRGIGSLFDTLPLGNADNALHLILGGTGLLAGLMDGGLPAMPKRKARQAPKSREPRARSGGGGRRRAPAGPPADGGAEPR